jgi:hypothetical protein
MARLRRWLLVALVPWVLACGLLSLITEGDQHDSGPDPAPAQTAIADDSKPKRTAVVPLWWVQE